MSKLRRRDNSICSCSSPRSNFLIPHSILSGFEEDIWTEIAKYLDGKSLVMLGSSSRWFHRLILEEDTIWKFACTRDLKVHQHHHNVSFKWKQLYASAFDGSHSYTFRQEEDHIHWKRIGAFSLESPIALLSEELSLPAKIPKGETIEQMLQNTSSCILKNVKTGIWIADLQVVRCPVCNLNTCEGTMQTLDARHIELFLSDGYKNGSWEYKEIGSHQVKKHFDRATGAIFDIKHLKDPASSEVWNLKSWLAEPSDWQPRARIACFAVAVNTNLQQNDGLHVRYHEMRDEAHGTDGKVVSIRISHQLL